MKNLIIPMIILVLSGCVSSKEYKARLAEIKNSKEEISVLQNRLGATESEKAKLNEEMSALQSRLNTIESEKAKLNEELSGLKKDISGLNETLKVKEAERIKLQEELTVKIKALEEDNVSLSKLLEAKKDKLTQEIVSLRDKLTENVSKVEEMNAKISDAEAKKDELKKEVAVLQIKISENQSEIQALQNETAKLKAKIEALSKEKAMAIEEKEKALAEFKKTHDSLVTELKTEIEKGEIAITQLKDKLSLSMVDKILFDSGSVEIKKEGKEVLDRIGAILKRVTDKQIKVEGHTDNVPISQRLIKKFPSNWELSTARATTVVRYLQDNAGIEPERLFATGYSEYRPIAPNDTDENKAKNRRIEIVLIPVEEAKEGQ